MSQEVQTIIDRVAKWDVDQLDSLQAEIGSLIDEKIEDLPNDDEGF